MKRQQMVLPWVLLVIPVLWLAALLASGYKDGMTLFDLMAVFPNLMEKPFAIPHPEISADRAGRVWLCRHALLLCQRKPASRRGTRFRPMGECPAVEQEIPG